MQDSFNCTACGVRHVYSRFIKTTWDKPYPVRCVRCGASYSVIKGIADRISPDMVPFAAPFTGRVSPWMPTHTRPIVPGIYECRFRYLPPDAVLALDWDGHGFRYLGKRVQMSTFNTWRGVWV